MMPSGQSDLIQETQEYTLLNQVWMAEYFGNKCSVHAANEVVIGALEMDIKAEWLLLPTLSDSHSERERETVCCSGHCLSDLYTFTDRQRANVAQEIQLFTEEHSDVVTGPRPSLPEWVGNPMPRDARWNSVCPLCADILSGTTLANLRINKTDWQKVMRDCGRNRFYWPGSARVTGPEEVVEFRAVVNAWQAHRMVAKKRPRPLTLQERRETVIEDELFKLGQKPETFHHITTISKERLLIRVSQYDVFNVRGSEDEETISQARFNDVLKKSPFRFPDNQLLAG